MPLVTCVREEEYRGVTYREGESYELDQETVTALGRSVTPAGKPVSHAPVDKQIKKAPKTKSVETLEVQDGVIGQDATTPGGDE